MIVRVVCWVAFGILLGCYSPSYVDCQIQCGANSSCPSGLTCDTANMCRLPNMIGACGPGSGSNVVDASTLDALPCPTWMGLFPPSNFDTCDNTFPLLDGDIDLEAGGTFNTDDLTVTDNNAGTTAFVGGLYNGVWAVHVKTFTTSNGIVNVVGSTPLLIVADGTMVIATSIDASAASSIRDPDCGSLAVTANTDAGGGGGGGGGGSLGGDGGAASGSTAAAGGAITGSASLVPLLRGCPGGVGGSPDPSAPGGAGGNSGGAFELAAGTSITLAAGFTLFAGGGGGGAGSSSMSLCGGGGCSSGGGGGGAGGSILLEAPMLMIDASVCAPGGGGGQGSLPGSSNQAGPGSHGTCVGGAGGAAPSSGGTGGAGGTNSSGAPGVADDSAGGGGGGAGRIHFHASSQANLMLGGGIAIVPTEH